MKYIVFIISVIALIWGLWIVFDERGSRQAIQTGEYCLQMNDNQAMNDCSNAAWLSAAELETRAYWAIGLGAVFSALSGFGIWVQRQDERPESKS